MIRAENIRKSFGTLHVLKGISLEVPVGKIYSIVGASGAGKTTLLQILGTLSRPDSGTVFIDGREVSGMGEKELSHFRNRKLGFVFQFHHLLPEFTALENVAIPAFIAGGRVPWQKPVVRNCWVTWDLKAVSIINPLNFQGRKTTGSCCQGPGQPAGGSSGR